MSSPEENVMATGVTVTLGGTEYRIPNIGVGWLASGRSALKENRGNPFGEAYKACRDNKIDGAARREMMHAAAAASRVGVTMEELLEWIQDPIGMAWLIWWGLTACGGQEVDRKTIEDGVCLLGMDEFAQLTEKLLVATGAQAMVDAAKNSAESPESVALLETETAESPGDQST
jgi:hypothetical protein